MKTETLYFDEKWKKASQENATWMVVRVLDDSGGIVRESTGAAQAKDKEPAGKWERKTES